MSNARNLANIISGGFTADDIPSLDTAKVTTGTFDDARISATSVNQHVDLSNLNADNLTSGTLPDARFPATLPAVNGSALTGIVTGKVLQVVSTTKTDVFSLGTGGTVFTDITGLSASITPSSTSSKIYIMSNVTLGMSTNSILMTRLVRGTTSICIGNASGNRSRASSGAYPEGGNAPVFNAVSNFLDSPLTTSATAYKVQLATENATAYVNRSGRNDNLARDATYTSSITLMEIGA